MPVTSASPHECAGAPRAEISASRHEIEIGLLTGCQDRPYVFGLSTALAEKCVCVDVIGSDEVDGPEMHTTPHIRFLNMRKSRRGNVDAARKAVRLLMYYMRLILYAAEEKPKILHVLWNNKFEHLDRTLLMKYYKMQGKKVVLTVHNVNQARRDGKDSSLNRLTLKIQYRLADHVFVHTEKMKSELLQDFGVDDGNVTVIPFGINNAVPQTNLTAGEAKRRLGIARGDKTILFFGRMRPYKGLEHLLVAYERLMARQPDYRLIIASEPKKGSEDYRDQIVQIIDRMKSRDRLLQRMEFIPDEDVEQYFKASDVLVLPYKEIFQSGVMFLAYSFGLPVVAANVGSFSDEIVEGRTGFLCKPGDATDMVDSIERYFASDLYNNLESRRRDIQAYALSGHSWGAVGDATVGVYAELLKEKGND